MPDVGHIEAGVRAAILRLRDRDGRLTPVERLKLRSLLLNLDALQGAPPPAAGPQRSADGATSGETVQLKRHSV